MCIRDRAQWEYACRAGTTTAFNLPLDGTSADSQLAQLAWYSANSPGQTRPVGQKQSNNLGLHDMHGSVYEWVEDWYQSSYYAQSPAVDPSGPMSGGGRVARGGSWYDTPAGCRASFRTYGSLNFFDPNAGFRVARTP